MVAIVTLQGSFYRDGIATTGRDATHWTLKLPIDARHAWRGAKASSPSPDSLESEPMMPDSDPFRPKTAVDGGQVEPTVIEPVTCLVCGCLCDDISVVKQGENITAAGNACALGREWLLRDRSHDSDKPAALIKGEPAEAAEAVELAARMLMKANAPIILGLGRSTNETVAAALELADGIGAVVEPGDSRSSAPRMLAFQRVGRVSATLGEVKNRADVVFFWGADPVLSHPRHWEHYSVEPRGRFIPEGRAGRTVIVVDQERTATASRLTSSWRSTRATSSRSSGYCVALVRGVALDAIRGREIAGADLPRLRELGERLMAARYGAFFHGPLITQGTMSEAAATLEAAYAGSRPQSSGPVRNPRHGRARQFPRRRSRTDLADWIPDECGPVCRLSQVAARRHDRQPAARLRRG